MELILIRHAKPQTVLDAPAGADPDLDDEGRAQADVLAAAFASGSHGPVTALLSSTMRRARQTAQPLAAALGLPVATDERLVELDDGWTSYGSPFEQYPSRAAAYDAVNAGTWGGHTYDPAAFVARVREGMEDVIAAHPDGRVAVVCHGGVISAYLSTVIGSSRPLFFNPGYTTLTRVLALPDGHREMRSAGERPAAGKRG